MTGNEIGSVRQDFEAALGEFRSNVEVRRLMFVVMHVLLPGVIMAASDCISGADYPPELAWMPKRILSFSGGIIAISGAIVAIILMRCHFGLVINSAKLHRVRTGEVPKDKLNWKGVTANFIIITALSAAGGTALALVPYLGPAGANAAALGVLAILILLLPFHHRKALRRSQELSKHWEKGEVPKPLMERHAMESLADCSGDVAIIVTMAVALFVGLFSAMSNMGAVTETVSLEIPASDIKRWGVPVLGVYMAVSLIISMGMVLRLRIAVARHSVRLAELRGEQDSPFAFRPLERTFLLYLVIALFAAGALTIVGWTFLGSGAAVGIGLGWLPLSAFWYGIRLTLAGKVSARKPSEPAAEPGKNGDKP